MKRRRLKIEYWPQQDRSAWDGLLEPGGLHRKGGAFAHLRPTTIGNYEQSYGHWLAFCAKIGVDLERTDPVDRVTDDRLRLWSDSMSDLTWTTRFTRLVGLRQVLQGIAPDRLSELLCYLCREAEWHANRQVRKGKIGRVPPTSEYLRAGLEYLSAVKGYKFKDATRFRDGLIVATLGMTALRISNFRDLEIGRSILIRDTGFDILLSGSETKNHRTLEKELPKVLIEPMQRYLNVYRPILLARYGKQHAYLWVNDWSNRYCYSSLGARFSRLTKKMLGIAIAPHYVRDSAATTIARLAPSKSRAIPAVLGQADLRTSERYYNQARCLDASRAYTPLIEDLTEEALNAQSCKRRRHRRPS